MSKFDKLIGNSQAKSILERLITSPPQTLLFQGPAGLGKKEFARTFAKKLINSNTKNPADLREFYPEGKAHFHSINKIREFIRETEILPFEAIYKVFLIHEADRMLPPSMNALLKILEEPPAHCIIILLTSHPEALLPTVVSRSFKVPFSLITEEEIINYLKDQKIEKDADKIACLSEGNFKKLQEILNSKKTVSDNVFDLGVAILQKKYPLSFEEEIIKSEETTLLYLFYFFRDLFLIKIKADLNHLFYKEKAEILKSLSGFQLEDLEEIEKRIEKMYLAHKLNIPLSHSICTLF